MKCHCSLLAGFKNGDKNVKTLLKGEQILLHLRKFYRKIGRKLIISYSNKRQPLLNASKVSKAIPAGSLKKRDPFKKTYKNKLSLVTDSDKPKNSSLVKQTR